MPDARPAIRAVILDAGGVILHPNFDWIAGAAAAHGVELDISALHRGYYQLIYEVDRDPQMDRRGMAVDSDAVRLLLMTRLLAAAGLDAARLRPIARALAARAAAEFPRESDIFHWAMPGIRDQLEALRAAGLLLAVASNNDGALQAQLERVGVAELFAAQLDSGIEGVAKPDPELLLRTARAIAVAPADCLYVGDVDRVDGVAARAAGMHFALLDPLGQRRASCPLCIAGLDAVLQHFCVAADTSAHSPPS